MFTKFMFERWSKYTSFLKRKRTFVFLTLIFSIIAVMIFGLSYAYFKKVDVVKDFQIVVEELSYTLESDSLNSNNEIIVPAGETVIFDILVTSNNSVKSKYQMVYTSDDDLTDVEVGYDVDTIDATSGEIDANGTKTISVVIENTGFYSVAISFAVKGGLQNNKVSDIILANNDLKLNNKLSVPFLVLNGKNLNGNEFTVLENTMGATSNISGTTASATITQDDAFGTDGYFYIGTTTTIIGEGQTFNYDVTWDIETNIEGYGSFSDPVTGEVWDGDYDYDTYVGVYNVDTGEFLLEPTYDNGNLIGTYTLPDDGQTYKIVFGFYWFVEGHGGYADWYYDYTSSLTINNLKINTELSVPILVMNGKNLNGNEFTVLKKTISGTPNISGTTASVTAMQDYLFGSNGNFTIGSTTTFTGKGQIVNYDATWYISDNVRLFEFGFYNWVGECDYNTYVGVYNVDTEEFLSENTSSSEIFGGPSLPDDGNLVGTYTLPDDGQTYKIVFGFYWYFEGHGGYEFDEFDYTSSVTINELSVS